MISAGIGTDFQADLTDMQNLARMNKGYRYILCVIDIFTRMAYYEPIKRKTGEYVNAAYEVIIKRAPLISNSRMATDAGKEFLNKHVQHWYKKNSIRHYTLQGDHKAAIVERFQRTLKERLYRLMTARKNYKYCDMLQKVVSNYNASVHRTLGVRPVDVIKNNEHKFFKKQFQVTDKQVTRGPVDDIKVGDRVLISTNKSVFEKGFKGYWKEEEQFVVATIRQGVPNKSYVLKDTSGEPIQGAFYREQVLKVSPERNGKPTKIP